MSEENKNVQPTQDAQTTPPEPQTPPAEAQTTETEPGPVPYARFKEVNEQLKELRQWRKQAEEAESERQRQEEEAETARLAEQQEFEKLANKRQAKIEELQGQIKDLGDVHAELDRYKSALDTYVKQAREGVPDHVLSLLDKLDPIEQLDYLTKNRENLGGAAVSPVPPTPRPSGETLPASEKKRREAVNIRKLW